MKKKVVSGLLIATLLLMSFAGCSSDSSSFSAAPSSSPSTTSSPQSQAKSDEVYTIIIGDSGSDFSANYILAVAFKEYAESHSDGRLVVNIFNNGQLGGDRELLEGVQFGQVTMMGVGAGSQVSFVPELGVLDYPFAFPGREEAYAAFENKELVDTIAELYDSKGMRWMGMYVQGFRTLTANKEIRKPADCNGLNIRTIENKNHMAIWSSIGANPTPIAFPELYTALQQGVVVAQENPIELIYSQKFYEQQKYIIDTNHLVQTIFHAMNKGFYDSLPDDLKVVVNDAMAAGHVAAREYTDANENNYLQEMVDYGVTYVTLTPEEKQAFKEATQGVLELTSAEFPEFFKIYDAAVKSVSK